MSPLGDPEIAHARTKPLADGAEDSARDAKTVTSSPNVVLPLRLSVARGGLGIELVSSQQLGPLVCEQLELALLGISYPVDLSKGVKQFRGRRSQLRAATVLVDLEELGRCWAAAVQELWGEPVFARLSVGSTAETSSDVSSRAANSNDKLECLCACFHSERGVLAFDLVLASGSEPRFIVDSPRSLGVLPFLKERGAMQAALAVIDSGLSRTPNVVQISRAGRSVGVLGLASALCLALLPQFGFRMPQVDGQVVVSVESKFGKLRCVLAQLVEPFQAGLRALQVSSTADFVEMADDLLSAGLSAEARQKFLQALDVAPGHQGLLTDLAEIDLVHGNRAESAVVFLEEKKRDMPSSISIGLRHTLLLAAALDATGRKEAAVELWSQAFSQEYDGVFAAHLACFLSFRIKNPATIRSLLDQGVAGAPLLAVVRMRRLEFALASGDFSTALTDAEQLEAMLAEPRERSITLLRLATIFESNGLEDAALQFLRRSLSLVPDDSKVMIRLGLLLEKTGETLRAAELLSAALRQLSQLLHVTHSLEERAELVELSHQCSFAMARILMREPLPNPEALLHLGMIPTRGELGGLARLTEAEIFHLHKNIRDRDHALARFLEAAQLGWVAPAQCENAIVRLTSSLKPPLSATTLQLLRSYLNKDERQSE